MSKKITVIDKSESSKVTITPQGFLKVEGFATRSGVFSYKNMDGSVMRQLRKPQEVFKKESLESLKGIPVTLKHPPELINAKNAKRYMVGFNSDSVEKFNNKIKTNLTITDQSAIDSIEEGKTIELSCGYECELEDERGTFDGEEYDAIQKNIKYNHIALVDKGRAGPEIKILMDSEQVFIQDGPKFESCIEQVQAKGEVDNPYAVCAAQLGTTKDQKGAQQMEKIMLEGKEFEVSPELAAAFKIHMEKMASEMDGKSKKEKEEMEAMDAMKKSKEEMQAKMDAMTSDLDKTKKELEEKSKVTLDEKQISEKVKSRLSLLQTAKRFLKDEKIEELSEVEIKKAVIKADLSSVNLDGKTEEYINASFDYIVEKTKNADDKLKDFGKKVITQADNKVETSEDVRKKAMERDKEAWKTPLAKI